MTHFDRDYYENGPATGKSLYENYHYIPERTEPTARYLRMLYPGLSMLDFGCAKGFLVKALRDMGVEAYGYDISEYAVTHCMPEVSAYLSTSEPHKCDVVIGKDVLEHIPKTELHKVLSDLSRNHTYGLFVVPLGDSGEYRIPCYHDDPSHVVVENEAFWKAAFIKVGWKIQNMSYDISKFKAHWLKHHKKGNAVFSLLSA